MGIHNILIVVTQWRGNNESDSLFPQFWGVPLYALGIGLKEFILSCLLSQEGTQSYFKDD